MNSTAQPDLDPQAPLPTGPTGLPKQRPALAQLREALTALHIGGVCRAVAYELLTYWSPGGTVFPSVTTLADGLGLKPRMVQYHLARLERVGLWVRIGRTGRTNIYALHLPGEAQEGFSKPTPLQPIAPHPCKPLHPKWSGKCSEALSGRSAAHSKNRVVRTPKPGKRAPSKVASTPSQSFARKKDLRPGISIVEPHADPLVVESFLSDTAAQFGIRRGVTTPKPTPARTQHPLPEPTAEQVAAARATFKAIDATLDLDRDISNLPRKGVGLPLDTAPRHRGGCPNCGHDRMMGGSCNECGHDSGDTFTPSADWNAGGDA